MKKISLIFILLIINMGCKRYDENPLFAFKSIQKRLEARWEIEATTVNSISASTNADTLQPDYYFFTIYKSKDLHENQSHFDGTIDIHFKGFFRSDFFYLTFSNDKKELKFWNELYNLPVTFPLGNIPGTLTNTFVPSNGYYLRETWKIIKLTDKELWLTSELNGNSYESHFRKREE